MKSFICNRLSAFALTASFLFSQPVLSQSIVVESARNEILVLRISEYTGTLQWQVYPYGVAWSDVENGTADTLMASVNGYQTAMIGKIHLDGIPQGFDFLMVLPGQGHYFNPDFLIEGETVRLEGHVTDIITETTLDWLKNKRDPEKPFCVLCHFKALHRKWEPAERYYREFIKRTFREPATLFDDYEGRGTAAKTAEMNVLKHMN